LSYYRELLVPYRNTFSCIEVEANKKGVEAKNPLVEPVLRATLASTPSGS